MLNLTDRLNVEVPKQIEMLKTKGGPDDADRQHAVTACKRIGKEGKPLLFGGDDVKSEELFRELVFHLAVSAFVPGGVRFFGLHWSLE